jgi:galactokinase
MTGGGFGGSAIALVETAAVEHVRDRITSAFGAAALTEPAFVDAEPGDGYGPLR